MQPPTMSHLLIIFKSRILISIELTTCDRQRIGEREESLFLIHATTFARLPVRDQRRVSHGWSQFACLSLDYVPLYKASHRRGNQISPE